MKKTIFSLMLAFATLAMAQTNDTIDVSKVMVGYDYTCHTTDADGKATDDTYKVAVLIGEKTAEQVPWYGLFKNMHAEEVEMSDENLEALMKEGQMNIPRVFVNYPETGKTTMRETVLLNDYETVEKSVVPKWDVQGDTATICGYLCQKAVAQLWRRTWTVWFAEDLPMPYGPWKLCGLPGLIVRAEADGVHRFEMFSVVQCAVPMVYERRPDIVPTKRTQFVKYRNKTLANPQVVRNPMSLLSPAMMNHIEVIDPGGGNKYVMMNGHVFNDKPNVFVPLDLE